MSKVCGYASASQEDDFSDAVAVVEWIDSCLSDLGSIPLGENKILNPKRPGQSPPSKMNFHLN